MGATINSRIQSKRDTTANWSNAKGFIPLAGEIIIYVDYKTIKKKENDIEVENLVPGIKVGDGQTYVQDLPFVDDFLRKELLEHMGDMNVHVTPEERDYWNNKINVTDATEVINGALIFNRN